MKSGAKSVTIGPQHYSRMFDPAAPFNMQSPLEVAALGAQYPFWSGRLETNNHGEPAASLAGPRAGGRTHPGGAKVGFGPEFRGCSVLSASCPRATLFMQKAREF